ncbi:major allergen I polypeptide chain 2-like [Ochotona curzoniae]|uniref:major allergen I polypeptide chain 2-like n=1 Tax=Ochotona curzoniae TaxID=130825 RepID=UPI001B350F5E|nr:major allergen I polypeptide chain 2-like [Ochotona curzoniae]
MKGTLAVLALLLSGELGLQRGESVVTCPIFYEVFGALSLGSRTLLDGSLSTVNATPAEKEALGKVQDCYNEGGLTAKTLDLQAMTSITTSPECISHSLVTVKENLKSVLPIDR